MWNSNEWVYKHVFTDPDTLHDFGQKLWAHSESASLRLHALHDMMERAQTHSLMDLVKAATIQTELDHIKSELESVKVEVS